MIRPSTRIDDLIERRSRRNVWTEFERALGVRLPRLQRPRSLVSISALLVLFFLTISLAVHSRSALEQTFAATAAIELAIAMVRLTRPLAVVVPCEAATFGDLTGTLLAHHFASFSKHYRPEEAGRWTAPEVAITLRCLLAEQLGVFSDRITSDTNIPADLAR
jgi:hypothetical protein